jgi:PTH1 family peptidyl-tRNA hydrolase
MNLSGPPVLAISRSYSAAPSDLILAHDDADLPLGMVRVRPDGRAAGHRGVASIVEAMGTESMPRLRMGVGRPGGEGDLADYVLDEFTADEEAPLREMIETATDAVEVLIREGVKVAMNRYNRRRGPESQQA